MWKQRRMESPNREVTRMGFSYTLPRGGLQLENEGGFTRVQLEGTLNAAQPGAPQVPYHMIHIAIPDGMKVAGVSVLEHEQKAMERPLMVMPGQHPHVAAMRFKDDELRRRYHDILQTKSTEAAEERMPFVEPDPKYYKLEHPYPANVAEAAGEQAMGPYRILAVKVNPVRYVPAKGALVVSHSFTLAVDLIKGSSRIKRRYTAEQIQLQYELAERLVINPEILRRPEGYKAPGSRAAYLIITNKAMREEFDRLAEWKTMLGLPARVVIKEDILAKVYGDFTLGAGGVARDEAEVIRNFMKFAYRTWGVCYLLIGGDVEVVPVREVAALSHYNWFEKKAAATPDENRCGYDAAKKQLNIHMKDAITAATPLLGIATGRRIPYNPSASATALGWYFATNSTYATQSATPTKYVVCKGPASVINDARGVYKITPTFSIPTDLYYGSLESTRYNRPGKHDWDLLDNGLYGYYSETGEPSGIDFRFQVCVGRAPCATKDEARGVVDKLIRYERFNGISTMATRKAIFAADYWGGPKVIFQAPAGAASAGDNQYRLDNATTCRIQLKEASGPGVDVIAEDGGGVYREIPYRFGATATKPGWYFALGPATLAPSGFSIFGIDIRIPTRYIVVRGPAGTLSPQAFWVDNSAADGALVEKEQVRALFRAQAPQVDLHTRLYRDFASTPMAAAGEPVVTGVLDTNSLQGAMNGGAMFCSLSGHSGRDPMAGKTDSSLREGVESVLRYCRGMNCLNTPRKRRVSSSRCTV